jgi:hypothetical protein
VRFKLFCVFDVIKKAEYALIRSTGREAKATTATTTECFDELQARGLVGKPARER